MFGRRCGVACTSFRSRHVRRTDDERTIKTGLRAKSDADVKDSRRDRLKLALRENLKRRKSQARGRSEAERIFRKRRCLLDDASGEKP